MRLSFLKKKELNNIKNGDNNEYNVNITIFFKKKYLYIRNVLLDETKNEIYIYSHI